MNKMRLQFDSILCNEVFARTAGVAFVMSYNPNVDEVMEIKTILAEAIVNSIIHGYPSNPKGIIVLSMSVDEQRVVTIEVEDFGAGIEDIGKARQPLYTSRIDLERSGMGMTIMESFSDEFNVESTPHSGTKIRCVKKLSNYEQ